MKNHDLIEAKNMRMFALIHEQGKKEPDMGVIRQYLIECAEAEAAVVIDALTNGNDVAVNTVSMVSCIVKAIRLPEDKAILLKVLRKVIDEFEKTA